MASMATAAGSSELFDRVTVVTEVCYHARHTEGLTPAQRGFLLGAAICALDRPSSWWGDIVMSADNVEAWAGRILQAYAQDKRDGVIKDLLRC